MSGWEAAAKELGLSEIGDGSLSEQSNGSADRRSWRKSLLRKPASPKANPRASAASEGSITRDSRPRNSAATVIERGTQRDA